MGKQIITMLTNLTKLGFLSLLLSTPVIGYVDHHEVGDYGVRTTIAGMRAFQVHYTNFTFYTLNVYTPGFVETGTYNSNKVGTHGEINHNIQYEPFFRWRAGPPVETGNQLDFFIEASSRGFFTIQIPGSIAYTKDGRMELDSQRRLVTMAGQFPVLGENGQIYLPEGREISVSRSGAIYVNNERVDKMKIAVFASFTEMQKMESLNGVVFVLTEPITTLEGEEYYHVKQGMIEQNNVLKAITGDIMSAKAYYDGTAKAAHVLNKSLSTVGSIASP